MSVYAGIDIAARSFDVVLRKQGQNQKVMSFDQSPKGHSAVIELLKNHPVEWSRLCCRRMIVQPLPCAISEGKLIDWSLLALRPKTDYMP